MKKAGKNSPAPTSSGKETLKEEVKASNHLETEEDSNVTDVNNDQKIKVLEQEVTNLGAQLQHFLGTQLQPWKLGTCYKA